jgi:YHS domain-containing protein
LVRNGVTFDKDSMNKISRVIRYLFWLLVVSWSVALLRRLVMWMGQQAADRSSHSEVRGAAGAVDVDASSEAVGMARRLVRDPVCGAHVAEVLAIPLREGGELLHFCSAECRDEYLRGSGGQSMKKIAASR